MRYWWNDKEVSVDEYEALNLEWKKQVEEQELQEKNLESSNTGSGKKSRNQKKRLEKKLP